MALDHYVPQVHLRKFRSPALTCDRLHAIRKADLHRFQPSPRDVCRIEAGNTNSYLREDRALEAFLQTIEPKYTGSIERLMRGEVNDEAIYTIAGFIAYIISCSPTAMRIGTLPLKRLLETEARLLDARGALPMAPESLGGKTLSELLASGKVKITVDPQYPQAIGIANVLAATSMYGNFAWEVLLNNVPKRPFFTSDNPVAIEPSDDIRVLNRLVPLTPSVALRIFPDINLRREDCDFSFAKFRQRVRQVGTEEVDYLNEAFVRCAESLVFYREELPWVEGFLAANRNYRIEPQVHELPSEGGYVHIQTQRIVEMAR